MRASCTATHSVFVRFSLCLCVSVPLWQVFDLVGRIHYGFRFDAIEGFSLCLCASVASFLI